MLTDFFWEQMLGEVIEELATSQPVAEYCTEYDANFVRDQFQPRNLEVTADKNVRKGQNSLMKINSNVLYNFVCFIKGLPTFLEFFQMHLKYPLYGTGSSAITYYSESITKTGPVSDLF